MSENKPEPEIRGGNRPADYIPEDNPPVTRPDRYNIATPDRTDDFEEAVQADCDDYDEGGHDMTEDA